MTSKKKNATFQKSSSEEGFDFESDFDSIGKKFI